MFCLPGKDLFTMSCVCKHESTSERHAATIYRRWLARNEAGRGTIYFETLMLFGEYHASRVMRALLRQEKQTVQTAVIAGGFPATLYLQNKNLDSWRPSDIAIFLFEADEVHTVQKMSESLRDAAPSETSSSMSVPAIR